VEDPAEGVSGPLWLRGGIPVFAADGFAYEVRNRVTLCRCGASKNKPFCDGSHAAIKFTDDT
jgi:CDGSH-type Zn-finger protein